MTIFDAFYFDEESDDCDEDLPRCPACGMEGDPLDPQPGDHLEDCPRNPWGYNHPDFLKNLHDDDLSPC